MDEDSDIEEELDRILAEHDLTEPAEQVLAEVLISDAEMERGRQLGDSADPGTWGS
jgi:hypothetical protein